LDEEFAATTASVRLSESHLGSAGDEDVVEATA
jgi:hypothetical protein